MNRMFLISAFLLLCSGLFFSDSADATRFDVMSVDGVNLNTVTDIDLFESHSPAMATLSQDVDVGYLSSSTIQINKPVSIVKENKMCLYRIAPFVPDIFKTEFG